MYDWPELRPDTDAFWQILKGQFEESGFQPPATLSRWDDETQGWLGPELFFSQTCGYPFVTRLMGKVELLGTPQFDIEGWQGPNYSSAVIVSRDCAAENLEQMRDGRFAYNSTNSLSGYRCMSALTGSPQDWFSAQVKSGGHRISADMVADGRADIAAIDAMCWHLYRQFEPQRANRLKVLQWTPLLPGLPYITNRHWNPDQLVVMKSSLEVAVNTMAASVHNRTLRICGVSRLSAESYKSIKSL